jgi:hypothetical protein
VGVQVSKTNLSIRTSASMVLTLNQQLIKGGNHYNTMDGNHFEISGVVA